MRFGKIREIDEQIFSNPHPRFFVSIIFNIVTLLFIPKYR